MAAQGGEWLRASQRVVCQRSHVPKLDDLIMPPVAKALPSGEKAKSRVMLGVRPSHRPEPIIGAVEPHRAIPVAPRQEIP